MKKEKTILLGGLVLILALGVYVIAWAADLDVGNNLNMTPEGKGPFKMIGLEHPSGIRDAATWGYVKDAVGGLDPGSVDEIGIWRQNSDTNPDIYLSSDVGLKILSGNLGIGTNDPQYLLDLQGTGIQTLQIKSTSTTDTRGAIITLGDHGNTTGELWKISSAGDGTDKPLAFYTCTLSTCASDPTIYMARDGKIGIGTSIPEYPLDVRGTGVQSLRVSSTSTSGNRGAKLLLGDANNNAYWQIFSTGTDAAKPLDFQFCSSDLCQGSSLVRFTTDGEIGLGTADPQEKLHVQGNTWVNNDLLVGGFIGITSCGPAGDRGIRIGDDSYIYDDSCAGGWPGGGYPQPDATLYITSGDDIGIKSGNDGKTNTNYGVYVNTDGRVGIGTDTVSNASLTIVNNALVPPGKMEGLMFFKPSTGDSVHLYIDNSANFNLDRTEAGGVDDTTRLIMDTDGDIGIGVAPGDYILRTHSDGSNEVLIGDDLTVGNMLETDDLHVTNDTDIYGNLFCQSTASIGLSYAPANLSVTGNISVGDDGTGTCAEGYEGKMRYYTYEEAQDYYAKFQICMQTDTSSYSWYTIKQYSWGGQSS